MQMTRQPSVQDVRHVSALLANSDSIPISCPHIGQMTKCSVIRFWQLEQQPDISLRVEVSRWHALGAEGNVPAGGAHHAQERGLPGSAGRQC